MQNDLQLLTFINLCKGDKGVNDAARPSVGSTVSLCWTMPARGQSQPQINAVGLEPGAFSQRGLEYADCIPLEKNKIPTKKIPSILRLMGRFQFWRSGECRVHL